MMLLSLFVTDAFGNCNGIEQWDKVEPTTELFQ